MSQRMTDEAVASARRDAGAALDLDCECDPDAHEPGCFEHEAGTAFVALETDHDRARSEEARLLEENRKQAEILGEVLAALRWVVEDDSDEAWNNAARLAKAHPSPDAGLDGYLRQTEQLQQKDAQIRALADALRRAEPFIADGETAAAVDAALRLAGRVK